MILKMGGGNVKVSHTAQAAQVKEMLQLQAALFRLCLKTQPPLRKATITGWGGPPPLCSPLWQQSSAATSRAASC